MTYCPLLPAPCTRKLLHTHHIAVQSKCTMSHLEGLKANESAISMPFIQCLNSGQMKAAPAYAASTCSHTECSAPEA